MDLRSIHELLSSDTVLTHDINSIVLNIGKFILGSLEQLAILQTSMIMKRRVPWLTERLKCKIKQRDRLYKHFKRSSSLSDYHIFKEFRNKLSVELKHAKQQYYYNK